MDDFGWLPFDPLIEEEWTNKQPDDLNPNAIYERDNKEVIPDDDYNETCLAGPFEDDYI
jgi:hypothetical protein